MQIKHLLQKTILTILAVFIIQIIYSQEKYLPGFILSLNGDTLNGFIDYRNWDRNPVNISFRETMSGAETSCGTADIKGFGVNNEFYQSATVQREMSPSKTDELLPNSKLVLANYTTFLQVIIQGDKSLYYLFIDGKDQFYIQTEGAFEFLGYKKYLMQLEDHTVIGENKLFLGQLALYLQDCPTIQSKLKTTAYTKKSLLNLYSYYNECTNSEIEYKKKKEKLSAEMGVNAGISLTSLNFKSSMYDYLVNTDYDPSVNFTAGISLDLIFPRTQGKWSFYNEFGFTSYKVSGSYEDYKYENNYTITYTTLGFSYLTLNTMIRFKYPVGKFFIFLNAGMANGFRIGETNYKKEVYTFWGTETVEEGDAIEDARIYEQGLIGGLGTRFKKFSFEIRYELGNGMSPVVGLKSTTNRFFFLLGYRFK